MSTTSTNEAFCRLRAAGAPEVINGTTGMGGAVGVAGCCCCDDGGCAGDCCGCCGFRPPGGMMKGGRLTGGFCAHSSTVAAAKIRPDRIEKALGTRLVLGRAPARGVFFRGGAFLKLTVPNGAFHFVQFRFFSRPLRLAERQN